jgi:phosphatidate cytidylyltransferase
MLKTRVLTALALLPPLLGLLIFAPAWLWSLAMAAVGMLALWEWSRLCKLDKRSQWAYLAACGVVHVALVALYVTGDSSAWLVTVKLSCVASALFWIGVAPLWLGALARPPHSVGALVGVIVVIPTWLALVHLRDVGGPTLPLATMLLVWIADVSAYFAGRRFGRTKLAPRISPGKTWQGVYGACIGVALYAAIIETVAIAWRIPLSDAGRIWLPLAAIALVALAVMGDLFESWMKRGADRKDSSSLLPGHGGVLDRIDALTPVLPAVVLLLPLLTT